MTESGLKTMSTIFHLAMPHCSIQRNYDLSPGPCFPLLTVSDSGQTVSSPSPAAGVRLALRCITLYKAGSRLHMRMAVICQGLPQTHGWALGSAGQGP